MSNTVDTRPPRRRRAVRNLWSAGVVGLALLGFAGTQVGTANAIANGEPVREGEYRSRSG